MAPLAEEGKRRSSERALVLSPSRHSSIRLGSDARTAHQQPSKRPRTLGGNHLVEKEKTVWSKSVENEG